MKRCYRLLIAALALPLLGCRATLPPPPEVPTALPSGLVPLKLGVFPVNTFHVLGYHDVLPSRAAVTEARDGLALPLPDLVQHFSWLRDNGHPVVSWDQVIASRTGGAALPPGAVMLSFDDAYESFHSRVLPLLRLFNYPATLAVVPRWIEEPAKGRIEYEIGRIGRARFMSWAQIQDAMGSGLVEIASHSYDSHYGHIGNPGGNKQPALVTRRFDLESKRYETDAEFSGRVRLDLQQSRETLTDRLGKAPRVMVWPYGAHSDSVNAIAASVGMPYSLTLDPGVNTPEVGLSHLRRDLIELDTSTQDIEIALRPRRVRTERVVSLDLAAMIADTAGTEARLGALIERVLAMRPTLLVLTAQAATPGEDAAKQSMPADAYFPTSAARTVADVANRVAWQLRTRGGVRVFFEAPRGTGAASTLALQHDLARQAAFAGFAFSESTEPGALSSAMAALRSHRGPVESIRRFRYLGNCQDVDAERIGTLRTRLQREAADADWILLNVSTEDGRACSLTWWQALRSATQTLPIGSDQIMIELNYRRNDHAQTALVDPLLTAYAGGFRHLAYTGDLYLEGLPEVATIRAAMSVDTHPTKR